MIFNVFELVESIINQQKPIVNSYNKICCKFIHSNSVMKPMYAYFNIYLYILLFIPLIDVGYNMAAGVT